MKKLIQLPLLLLLTIFAGTLSATQQPIVVATSGLMLRSEANTQSKVIAAISFGEQVTMADDCTYSADTLLTIEDYYRYRDGLTGRDVYNGHDVDGNWVRVTYNGDTGFVFNAYLYDGELKHYSNSEYELIYPGTDLDLQVYHPAVYHFYGVYDDGQGAQEVKAIDVSYVNSNSGLGGVMLTTKVTYGLHFMIASRNKIQPHRFTGRYFDLPASKVISTEYDNSGQSVVPFPTPFDFQVSPSPNRENAYTSKLTLTHDGWSQVISTEVGVDEYRIEGAGDFDGDGKEDFLLTLYGERITHTRLYLTSQAEEGEWVGLAAVKYLGGC